jgi:hypothetical protein
VKEILLWYFIKTVQFGCMAKLINIATLRKQILEEGLGIITVFGNGEIVNVCSEFDYGEEPYKYFLNLDGNAELLTIKEASPIWQNLLEGMEKKRPIYRISDPESKGWMEIVTYENEK